MRHTAATSVLKQRANFFHGITTIFCFFRVFFLENLKFGKKQKRHYKRGGNKTHKKNEKK